MLVRREKIIYKGDDIFKITSYLLFGVIPLYINIELYN